VKAQKAEQARELIAAGWSNRSVARHLRTHATSVAALRADMGLPVSHRTTTTLEAAWWALCEEGPDGHRYWAGPTTNADNSPILRHAGREYTARRVAFKIRHGRWPTGVTRPGCGDRACISPDHMDDFETRHKCRQVLAEVRGIRRRVERCKHGHDLAVHGRFRDDGTVRYCEVCRSTRDQESRRSASAEPAPLRTAAPAAAAQTRRPTMVDAQPARAHVELLRSGGMSAKAIARAAGVSHGTVEYLIYGRPCSGRQPAKQLRASNAQKLMAVRPGQPEPERPSRTLSAIGSQRRLQALVLGGWPIPHLAARLGCPPSELRTNLLGDNPAFTSNESVAALYNRLWDQDPTRHGVPADRAALARDRATRAEWAVPLAWDDDTIDDPAASPDSTGHCGRPRGPALHRLTGTPLCARCRSVETRTTAAAA
jgi:hypothetical protein